MSFRVPPLTLSTPKMTLPRTSDKKAIFPESTLVITKYIEIEMDAVAKDGEMLMQFISEQVKNAGAHSSDATLILPLQDLDPETVRRIEKATRKIRNALNVTGLFNIQFIC